MARGQVSYDLKRAVQPVLNIIVGLSTGQSDRLDNPLHSKAVVQFSRVSYRKATAVEAVINLYVPSGQF